VRELLKKIGPLVRALGFRGSGGTYRRVEGDFVFVINFQASRSGNVFYVNLGAQPTFISAEDADDPAKLKEYQCFLRTRVGREWPQEMPDPRFAELTSALTAEQAAFFGNAQTLREALGRAQADDLLDRFCSGNTAAYAALQLARAAAALGHAETARQLAERGLAAAGDALALRGNLKRVLEQLLARERARSALRA
jgi:hypothetical protein